MDILCFIIWPSVVSVVLQICTFSRPVARSENLGWHVLLGGDNVPPLVEIGLTDLTKSGGARAPSAPPACDGPA